MNTKILSNRALSIIDQYRHFTVGTTTTSVPYFNNKTARSRIALRTFIGKGSPKEIFEEVESIMTRDHLPSDQLSDKTLKKILIDRNIGIDCSGFAYYILNAESQELGRGTIDKHLSFINCTSIIGKIRCSLRPIENCDVATLAHDKNSLLVPIDLIKPGDMITMAGQSVTNQPTADRSIEIFDNERDHILVIHQIDYQNFTPFKLYYSHAVAYPEDGIYGTGIRQGTIQIADMRRPITNALWDENGRTGENNRLFIRATKSKTEVRRLKWM